MYINSKVGGYAGRVILIVGLVLTSLFIVSALNESSENTKGISILPVEETSSTPPEAPISILPIEQPTEIPSQEPPSDSPTGTPISIQPIPPDESQNIPAEQPTPPVSEEVIPTPSLFSTFLNLVIDKITAFVGEVINIRATLTDENLTPLSDRKIDFYADAQIIGSNVTDSEGTAKVSWNTSSWLPGAYTVTADYAGDEIYSPTSGDGMIALNSGLDDVSSNITTKALPIIPENGTIHSLAKVFNEETLDFDRDYAQEYLQLRNNFTDLKFKRLFDAPEAITFTGGNKIDNLKGIQTNKGKFAMDLVYCDEFEGFCKFRINGVPTERLYPSDKVDGSKTDSFSIDGNYTIKVTSVKVNQCDNHRFCHLGYEGYHKVDVVVEKK